MTRHLSRIIIALALASSALQAKEIEASIALPVTISSFKKSTTISRLENSEKNNKTTQNKISTINLQKKLHKTALTFPENSTKKKQNKSFKQVLITIAAFLLLLLTFSLYRKNHLKSKVNKLLQKENAELLISKDKAEKEYTIKAQFLSTITHELRTPLYAVTGLTHLLLTENPTENQRKYLNSIKFSGEHLLSLINNILDLNKFEANKVEINKKPFNLKKSIEDMLLVLEKSANDKNNKIHFDFDENIQESLLGDSLMTSQILINLISNAIKFTQNGDIHLRVHKKGESKNGANVHFEIEDNGQGISKDKQKSIFESFTQGSLEINRKFGGTGLGLSIVKSLLGLLDSEIILESALEKGSRFSFDLQFDLVQSLNKEKSSLNKTYDVDYPDLENHKFLVVEDNKVNQMITCKILKKNKISCDIADNGEIAVEKARTEKYDLILMDIHMPGIGGIEATKRIRAFNNTIPILALTAVTIDENIDILKDAGVNDIIPKPYKVNEFFYRIHNAIKNTKA